MEQLLLEKLERDLALFSGEVSLLRSLSIARSLVSNPHSSDATRRAVLDSLIRFLDAHRDGDPTILRHALILLSFPVSFHHPSLHPLLRFFLASGEHIAADALVVLVSIAKNGGGGGVAVVGTVLDEKLVLSLASTRFVSVRERLLSLLALGVDGTRVYSLFRPGVVIQLLLGLAEDLYPSIRRAAIDGLTVLCNDGVLSDDVTTLECCYNRGAALLEDEDELVRVASIQLVCECGRIFAAKKVEADVNERIDMIFVQLCSVARDMSMKVRVEAFVALGKIKLVSESVLLQSLSKKVSGIKGGKKVLPGSSSIEYKFSLSRAAGAFIHGIEDEFYQVRAAACNSLGMLAVFSVQYADDALNLLMYMLNDDVVIVRLQTLQTLFHMATCRRLVFQEKHMHMFLGLLADNSILIRGIARKVLRLVKLPTLEVFQSTVHTLVKNLEAYPEEEEDIFLAVFFVGKNHGKFAAKLVEGFAEKIVPSSGGELSLDSPQLALLLMLTVSLCFLHKKLVSEIPPAIFSCAITLFGRISWSLRGVIDQDALLAYLFHLSNVPSSLTKLKFKEDELLSHAVEGATPDKWKHGEPPSSSEWPICCVLQEIKCDEDVLGVSAKSTFIEPLQQKMFSSSEELKHSIKLILERAVETWPLIQLQFTTEVKRTLSACREELEIVSSNGYGSDNASVAFASYYVLAIWLLAETWGQLPLRTFGVGMISLDLTLDKLDLCLRRMRYEFPGLCKEEEGHILELMALSCVVRLYGICSHHMLKKLQGIISCLELLYEGGSSNLSEFANQLKKSCTEGRVSNVSQSFPFPVHRLLGLFNLDMFPFAGQFEHVKAELEAIGINCGYEWLLVKLDNLGRKNFLPELFTVPSYSWLKFGAMQLHLRTY
ncbi:hypothetical protein J5N97_014882 [Dioscorea zingiberensis]|uniref:ARM repeat superfamily protein n=1 Tax=Dioscorea zingiberensis TaxID=325984 RepID=A0A9D5CUA8_9LILI|nr:hypothetical protein J5N97_014882 [Dioscorea zingiberensis]